MRWQHQLLSLVIGLVALQDNVEDKWREQKAVGEEGEEPEVDEQGKPLTKKQRQQLKRAADKERAKQRQATQDRMEPQVAIPNLTVVEPPTTPPAPCATCPPSPAPPFSLFLPLSTLSLYWLRAKGKLGMTICFR